MTTYARYLCAAMILSSASAHAADKEKTGQGIVNRYKNDEKTLVRALSDPTLWKQAGPRITLSRPRAREAELLSYLHAVQVTRTKAVISILIDRISFNLYEGIATKRFIPTDMKYPAYATLKSVGLPAIPALIGHLKLHDPLDEEQRRNPRIPEAKKRQYGMVWMCIADIYAEKKFFVRGIPMAEMRIGFEIEDIRKKTGRRNTVAEKRLERVIKDMQKTEEFLKKR